LIAALSPLIADAAVLSGKVVGIADGDTITVLTPDKVQVKIRLVGIDAPEKGQPFGQKSKDHLASLVFAKVGAVEHSKTDRYGRTLGRVLVGGIDANLEQIRSGFAWHYKEYAKDQPPVLREQYSAAEAAARRARLGLWADSNPQKPAEFRKDPAANKSAKAVDSCLCSGTDRCTGSKGGTYCVAPNGKKKYG